jgi:hypothetical protein
MGVCQNATAPKLSLRIDKNAIIAKYDDDCHKIGYSNQVTTVKKGEPTNLPTTYPTIFQLVRDCSMKPSKKHHYRVTYQYRSPEGHLIAQGIWEPKETIAQAKQLAEFQWRQFL